MGFGSSTFPVVVEQCQGPRSKGIAQDSAGSSSAASKQLHVHDKHAYQELVGFAMSGHEVPDLLPLNNRVKMRRVFQSYLLEQAAEFVCL